MRQAAAEAERSICAERGDSELRIFQDSPGRSTDGQGGNGREDLNPSGKRNGCVDLNPSGKICFPSVGEPKSLAFGEASSSQGLGAGVTASCTATATFPTNLRTSVTISCTCRASFATNSRTSGTLIARITAQKTTQPTGNLFVFDLPMIVSWGQSALENTTFMTGKYWVRPGPFSEPRHPRRPSSVRLDVRSTP